MRYVKNRKKKKKMDRTETIFVLVRETNHNVDIKTQAKINST